MKSLRVGLCGVGNVGRAVLKTLISSSKLIEVQGGVHFDIELVGARRGKKAVPFNGINVTKDLKEVATNPNVDVLVEVIGCLLYTSPSPRDRTRSRMPSSA